MADPYVRSVVALTGLSRVVPGEPDALRWWDGELALLFENVRWEGMRTSTGSLLQVSPINNQIGVPEGRVSVQFVVTEQAAGLFFAHDLTGIDADVGFIRSADGGSSWERADARLIGRLSEITVDQHVATALVETWYGDVDRGVVRYWNDQEHQAEFPGDTFFSRMEQLASGSFVLRGWPP